MSRGFGWVERALLRCLQRKGYAATVGDLARRFYDVSVWERPTDSQRQTVIRAVRALAKAGYPIGWLGSERQGAELVIYRSDSESSRKVAEQITKRIPVG
jgi:hypothetical protein